MNIINRNRFRIPITDKEIIKMCYNFINDYQKPYSYVI